MEKQEKEMDLGRAGKVILFSALIIAGLAIVAAVTIVFTKYPEPASSPAPSPAPVRVTVTATPAAVAQPAPSSPARTLLRQSGTGPARTRHFTAGGTGNYAVRYTFDCGTALGGNIGNFIIDGNGGAPFSGAIVNRIGVKGSGTARARNFPGTHYLDINSDCQWSVTVTGTK